jgi:anti-anti-sigma factor
MTLHAIIELEQGRDMNVVVLRGEFDLASATDLRQTLGSATSVPTLIVDLASCTFMDSTIINILLQASHGMHLQGGTLGLVIPPGTAPAVHRAFEMLGLQRVLPICPTRAAMVDHLRAPEVPSTSTGMRLRVLSTIIDELEAEAAEQRSA